MDDVTKQLLRKAKADAVDDFRTLGEKMIAGLDLGGVDPRLLEYAHALLHDPESHNLFELLAFRRFVRHLKLYEFRRGHVRAKIVEFESLRFPADTGLRSIKLSPIQVFILSGIYGFWRPDGRRLIRYVLLLVPRKFGKTTITAGILIDELLFGPADAQAYTCSNSYKQAKICFDMIRGALFALDRGGRRFRVNREAILSEMPSRPAYAQCLASNPKTLDGLNASCYVLDEFAQARSPELRNVMKTSTGSRQNWLEIIITTASDVLDGPFIDTLDAYKKILLGDTEDDSVFALILQPDVDDDESDPATWRKVQPHLGYTVMDDYYEAQWVDAQRDAASMLAFRTKLLNVFATNEAKAWITGDEIRNLNKEINIDHLPDERPPYTMVAFDLSVWDDFSAVAYQVHRPETGTFHFHVDYYIPEDTIARHTYSALYRTWVEKGFLKALPGSTIDYDTIVKDIIARNGRLLIAGIGYDPYHSKQAVNLLQAYGAGPVLKPVKQTYGAFTGAVEAMELMIKNGQATFTPNPITAWCFANCTIDEDPQGNRKPVKRQLSLKIDGAICCLMAQDLFLNFKK